MSAVVNLALADISKILIAAVLGFVSSLGITHCNRAQQAQQLGWVEYNATQAAVFVHPQCKAYMGRSASGAED